MSAAIDRRAHPVTPRRIDAINAAPSPGLQVRLAALLKRRAEMQQQQQQRRHADPVVVAEAPASMSAAALAALTIARRAALLRSGAPASAFPRPRSRTPTTTRRADTPTRGNGGLHEAGREKDEPAKAPTAAFTAARSIAVINRFAYACRLADRDGRRMLPRHVVISAFTNAAADAEAPVHHRAPLASNVGNVDTKHALTAGRRIALLKHLQPIMDPFVDSRGMVAYERLVSAMEAEAEEKNPTGRSKREAVHTSHHRADVVIRDEAELVRHFYGYRTLAASPDDDDDSGYL
jgi:hypothetical protein